MRLCGIALLFFANGAFAQEHWVETWTAAQQIPRAIQGQAPTSPVGFENQTVRMIVHTAIGGRRLRVELSNTFNSLPLAIGAAHIAIRASESAIVPASDRALLVNGKPSFSIPPGALVLTDPVDLEFAPMSDLAVSVYVPGATPGQTQHTLGLHTTYISGEGDFTAKPSLDDARTSLVWYWISGIEVMAPAKTGSVIAFGDSITDGFRSTPNANHMWPAVLSRRILSSGGAPAVAVVNEAISGNQILHDGAGINALARFDRDVISRAGVKWLIVLEGINDIGRGLGRNANPHNAVTADDVISGLRQMVERAHAHGIKVAGVTLTPYEGAAYYSEKGEDVRQAVNTWIRTGRVYDAVIDFDSVIRDPTHPTQFKPEYDVGDHLHPNDTGYKAMADSINLSIFK